MKTLAAVVIALVITTASVKAQGVLPDSLASIVNQAGPQIDLVERDWRPLIPKIMACKQRLFDERPACIGALISDSEATILGTHARDAFWPIIMWFPEMRRDYVTKTLFEAMERCALDGTPLRFCVRTTLAVVNVILQ